LGRSLVGDEAAHVEPLDEEAASVIRDGLAKEEWNVKVRLVPEVGELV
jgi:hypothetical protein